MLPGMANAQKYKPFEEGKFYLGIKGGFHANGIAPQNNYGQIVMDYKVDFGMNAGLFGDYRFNQKHSILIEAMFMQLGGSYEDFYQKKSWEKVIRLNYWSFPLMYRYSFGGLGTAYEEAANFFKPRIYIAGGFQPGLLINADAKYAIDNQPNDFIGFITEGGNPNDDEISMKVPPESTEDLYQTFDVMLVMSLGIRQNLQSNVYYFVDLRGGFSLIDINAEEWRLPAPSGNYFASRNAFIGINAGIGVRLF